MEKGIGYLSYCKDRMNEGYRTQQTTDGKGYEQPGQERFVLYFARTHLHDVDTGVLSRSYLKVGQAKYLSAVMRTRNQPGTDFRCYAEVRVHTLQQTFDAEALVKELYKTRRVKLNQNQQELYNITDEELSEVVYNVVNKLGFEPVEVKFYV